MSKIKWNSYDRSVCGRFQIETGIKDGKRVYRLQQGQRPGSIGPPWEVVFETFGKKKVAKAEAEKIARVRQIQGVQCPYEDCDKSFTFDQIPGTPIDGRFECTGCQRYFRWASRYGTLITQAGREMIIDTAPACERCQGARSVQVLSALEFEGYGIDPQKTPPPYPCPACGGNGLAQ